MPVARKKQPQAGKQPHREDSTTGQRSIDEKLDDALENTFPASDPVAVTEASISRKPRHDRDEEGKEKRRDDC